MSKPGGAELHASEKGGIRVLVVDRNSAYLNLAKRYLEAEGDLEVVVARNTDEARQSLSLGGIDAIVAEAMPPQVDGIGLLRELRKNRDRTPFIIYTGRRRERIASLAEGAGEDLFVRKGRNHALQYAILSGYIRRAVGEIRTSLALRERTHDCASLRGLLQHHPDPTLAIDLQGRVILWNRAMEELSDTPAEKMLGKGDREYAIPFYGRKRAMLAELIFSSDEEIARHFNIFRREGSTLVADVHLPCLGTNKIFQARAAPLYNGRGELAGAIESVREITPPQPVHEIDKSGEKYRSLVENARMAIVVVQQGRIQFMNPFGLEYFGISGEEAMGRPAADFIHPEDRAWVLENHEQRMRGAVLPTSYTFRVIDREKRTRTVEITVIPIAWEDGPASLNLLQDITDRVQMEAALREREELYRTLAETAPAMIYLVDPGGCVRYANSRAAKPFGMAAEALVGRHLTELFPREQAEQHLAAIREVIETGEPLSREIREEFPDAYEWIEVRLTPVKDAEGKVCLVLGMSLNITERKRMMEQLRESERLLSDVFQSIRDGIVVVDREMRILEANHTVKDWLLRRESCTGRRCYEVFRGRNSPCDDCPVPYTLATGAPASAAEPLLESTLGLARWLEIHSSPLLDTDTGGLKGAIIYMKDVSNQKILEEVEKKALEQIERNLVQLSILNDHIRNPLAVIVALASMEGGEAMDRILVQAKEIDRIITELDMGWLESEKIREFMRKHCRIHRGEPKATE